MSRFTMIVLIGRVINAVRNKFRNIDLIRLTLCRRLPYHTLGLLV